MATRYAVVEVAGQFEQIQSGDALAFFLASGDIMVGNGSGVAASVAVSGDATLASTGALTLATVNSGAGTFNWANVTVNGKGLSTTVTAATLTSADFLVGNGSNVPTGVAMSGDATLANTGAVTLANTAVTPGSYQAANITVDSKGRVTGASNGAVSQVGYTMTNGNAGSLVICTPVYVSDNDTVDKAKADSASTFNVMGLNITAPLASSASGPMITGGVLSATTGQWDSIAGTTGGLTAGTWYYLSDATAGNLTATAPTTVGHYVVPVGFALSTTELQVRIGPSILL